MNRDEEYNKWKEQVNPYMEDDGPKGGSNDNDYDGRY